MKYAASVGVVVLTALGACAAWAEEAEGPRSSDWVAALPDGETKRKMIVGCTSCHPMGLPVAFRMDEKGWGEAVRKMKKIDDDLDLALIPFQAGELEAWLSKNAKMPSKGALVATAKAEFREYPAGKGTGFYHDMALAGGKAWIADYFGNILYGVDPATGAVEEHPIPVTVAPGKPGGAHAIDVTRDGQLWITFTKSEQVAHFDTKTGTFKMYGPYPKGGNVQYFVLDADRFIYEDKQGGIWTTHFSKVMLSRLDPRTGEIKSYPAAPSTTLPEKAVHLYAAVADSKGKFWYTETHGNRLGTLDPETGKSEVFEIFAPWSGPKRLAIDPDDRLWIPQLASGEIALFDTKARKVERTLQVPIPGDYVYAVRRNRFTGDLWATGCGSDSLYRLDPKTFAFTIFRLPRRGAYTRTVAFDPDGTVWTCYSAFPNKHTITGGETGTVLRVTPKE